MEQHIEVGSLLCVVQQKNRTDTQDTQSHSTSKKSHRHTDSYIFAISFTVMVIPGLGVSIPLKYPIDAKKHVLEYPIQVRVFSHRLGVFKGMLTPKPHSV